jgi:uncharacterized protein YbjQ (UPF0145 family)
MIFSTTGNIEGKKITQYCGLVSGDAILGANVMKDMMANVHDFVGGRATSYEKELQKARELATESMLQHAVEKGANAIIGINLDFEVMGKENGMIMVSIWGTAVIVV